MIKFEHTNTRQEKALNELFSQIDGQYNDIDIKLLFSDTFSIKFLNIFVYVSDQGLYNRLLEWLNKPCNSWHFDKKYQSYRHNPLTYYYDTVSYDNGVWLNIQKVEKGGSLK